MYQAPQASLPQWLARRSTTFHLTMFPGAWQCMTHYPGRAHYLCQNPARPVPQGWECWGWYLNLNNYLAVWQTDQGSSVMVNYHRCQSLYRVLPAQIALYTPVIYLHSHQHGGITNSPMEPFCSLAIASLPSACRADRWGVLDPIEPVCSGEDSSSPTG